MTTIDEARDLFEAIRPEIRGHRSTHRENLASPAGPSPKKEEGRIMTSSRFCRGGPGGEKARVTNNEVTMSGFVRLSCKSYGRGQTGRAGCTARRIVGPGDFRASFHKVFLINYLKLSPVDGTSVAFESMPGEKS
jgi:hypothetical protein